MATGITTPRQEHLEWCKRRALEYVDRDDLVNGFLSMVSDLGKHEETCNHPAIELGTQMLLGGFLDSTDKMRNFIMGFN